MFIVLFVLTFILMKTVLNVCTYVLFLIVVVFMQMVLTACGICCRVLCETVKAFVAKVAQAHENDSEKDSKDIATKVHFVSLSLFFFCPCLLTHMKNVRLCNEQC